MFGEQKLLLAIHEVQWRQLGHCRNTPPCLQDMTTATTRERKSVVSSNNNSSISSSRTLILALSFTAKPYARVHSGHLSEIVTPRCSCFVTFCFDPSRVCNRRGDGQRGGGSHPGTPRNCSPLRYVMVRPWSCQFTSGWLHNRPGVTGNRRYTLSSRRSVTTWHVQRLNVALCWVF